MQELLRDCRSIEVKRQYLWFAEHQLHGQPDDVDLTGVDLGQGKQIQPQPNHVEPVRPLRTVVATLENRVRVLAKIT